MGWLYHSGSVVFGPALNEAYTLERKVASNPRVIIAKSLNLQIATAAEALPRHWPFVAKNDDGYYSTDFLTMLAMSDAARKQIDRKIDHWLSLHQGNEQIYLKYDWLHKSWVAAKAESTWRRETSLKLRGIANK